MLHTAICIVVSLMTIKIQYILTDEGLHGGNLPQVLQQLVDGVIMLWSDGVLMVQQQLTGEKNRQCVSQT